MSEESNSGSNNLCTTEDAFEIFQAGAVMCEEDEFITLSDIVPPQPEIPNLCNELNEIPYDNEVVLSSNDDVAPLIDGNNESSNLPNNGYKPQNVSNCESKDGSRDSHPDEGNHGILGKRNKSQKKSRKKAKTAQNHISYQSDSSCLETENDSFVDNKATPDNVHSTTSDKNGTKSKSDIRGENRYLRRTRRERIPNTSKYSHLSETEIKKTPSNSTTGKRRGRPRKSTLENTAFLEPDSTNIDSSVLATENLNCAENNKTKSSEQTLGRKHTHDTPKVSQADEHINSGEMSKISECNSDILQSEQKKPSRRGRKKIIKTNEKPGYNIEESQILNSLMTTTTTVEKNNLPINELMKEDLQIQSESFIQSSGYELDDMDIDDDICLSKIKENINNITENFSDNIEENMLRIHGETTENDITSNKDAEIPIIADFEKNIDKVAKEISVERTNLLENNNEESLLVEDTSKRPNRRKAKKIFKYDTDSDEDPFANVELSNDEQPMGNKKSRYCDDDEYIPEGKRGKTLNSVTTSSDSDMNEDEGDGVKHKRKKGVNTPQKKKRGSKMIKLDDEELSKEIKSPLTMIKEDSNEPLSMKPPAEAWATSNEFENFIAQKIQGSNLKIKKVSSKQKTDSTVAPIDIPVLKQPEPKKFIEMSSQTSKTSTSSTGVQTSTPNDIPMKLDLPLTSTQSQKACEFLNSIVTTTAELGQLMKDKSEDFMKKKINVTNVTGTFKMDYCVRKSFLLFKLARHNLLQMEEDLAKQYDEFLRNNRLSHCREVVNQIAPKPANLQVDSDSDCEIVDVKEGPTTSVNIKKPKINPKTVFLNKELSIKITKKPSADKNVNSKPNHTLWINDSVMVKKVKPTQSFLAQDSRNKKPPDYVTEKMVSDFFENYYHEKVVAVCAPFVSSEWSVVHREYACNYFETCIDFDEPTMNTDEVGQNLIEINANSTDENCSELVEVKNPKSLSLICADLICSCLYNGKQINEDPICDGKHNNRPLSLFQLCYQSLLYNHPQNMSNNPPILNKLNEKLNSLNVLPLKTLAYRSITQLISLCANLNDINENINENTHNSDVISDNGSFCEDVNLHDEIVDVSNRDVLNCLNSVKDKGVKSLFSLCIRYIQTIYGDFDKSEIFCCKIVKDIDHVAEGMDFTTRSPKPLISIVYKNIMHFMFEDFDKSEIFCCKIVKDIDHVAEGMDFTTRSPKPLISIVYKNIMHFMFEDNATSKFIDNHSICNRKEKAEDFTVNCINTMSEDAFHSLDPANQFQDDDYEPDTEDYVEDNEDDGNEWAAQVQMQVLRSCITPVYNATDEDRGINSGYVAPFINSSEHELGDVNNDNHDPYKTVPSTSLNNITIVPHIKLEVQDDIAENIVDSSIVKIEPVHGLDGMTIIPESIMTKSEPIEHVMLCTDTDDYVGIEGDIGIKADVLAQTETPVYNVNKFEQFVRKNKMIRLMDNDEEDDSDEGELLSQSGTKRIWREHEPDHDAGIDINESLLVPQTYEPINIDNAKGVLMESSSDESKDSSKRTSKKKFEKKKVRPKKGKEVVKTSTIKEVPAVSKEVITSVKDKIPINEVAKLTRRMRGKIRQEEKKIESSDSDSDNIALSLKRDKNKTKDSETSKKLKQGESSSTGNKEVQNEIQCNNVDSTEPALENKGKCKTIVDEFTGFSAIDQNEISSYQKFMKYVYDKIIPEENISPVEDIASVDGAIQNSNRPISPLLSTDEPVELLESQPSMPIFNDEITRKTGKKLNKVKESKNKDKHNELGKNEPKFIEKYGWHIYAVDSSDGKLYQNCHIPLEKLPESFVDTYLEYRDITDRDRIDKEVDKLANLQTLNRSISLKNDKSKGHHKGRSCSVYKQNSADVSQEESLAVSDCLNELTPSEDEGSDIDYEIPLPVSERTTENNMAKNSLMDEHGSDSDAGGTKKIKQELINNNELKKQNVNYKTGPKSKTKTNKANLNSLPSSEPLMLTADKMMNKELNLLHAPIVKNEEPREITTKELSPKDEMKPKRKSLRNSNFRSRLKTEDDSSSEEEKQWVSTKEKLLKRVGKKEDTIVDDAKRAKLVDDFIERRGEGSKNRRSSVRGSRRSQKKFLEKLKQQRVLSKELLGEPSTDLSPGGKRGANVSLFKGRRNIRQVIDKKSLQKSTVLANMEEFERKRRLNAKQNKLRELLGCEEGVNVLVINDEVCLEYDFEEQRPVVTVHPFFTKVMKAHQYEGVKFMWDACFESLSSIESGQGGGGCILAHCMGLGKTLQVLALLHTVLTHPRAGMHRVLVCCPLSTVLNWVDEIHKWIGPVTNQIKVFELSKLKKTYERAYQLEDWYNGGGIFIIGYELFRSLTTLDPSIDEVRPTIINKIRSALLDPGPDIIICDEGHLLKNDCSVLAVAMSRVVTKRRIVLTGTPMQNNLREYYCMVNFIKPKLLGTYSEYSNRFGNPIMNGQHRDSVVEDIKLMKARTHILHKVLEGCLQRQEASVLYPYLPKKHEYTVFIPLTKCQWDLYKHYMHHYTKKSKNSILRDFHILQKIWSHPLVLHNFQTRYQDRKKEIKPEKLEDDLALEDKEDIKPPDTETWWLQYLADGAMLNSIDSSNKFVAVFRILHECVALGDKVLIFSTSLNCLDALECFLRQNIGWNLGQEYYRLDGSVPPEVRQKWVREYNAENNHKTKLFLISTRAGCLGLNMTAANRVIILDTSWNPAHDIQSIFRVYRFGQKKDCYIYRLVAMGTMEQKIYERSVTKQAVACRVVDEQQIDRHYNMAELTELYKFDEQGAGVAGGVAVGIADVALLRVARDAAIHAVHEHDSLLRGSGEQGLPEHERAAAWMQFQQEHAHKQMQNDIETDLAARTLKKQQEEQHMKEQLEQQRLEAQQQRLEAQQQHLEAQQQLLEKQQAQVLNIKTEDGPVHDLLVPREVQSPLKGKGVTTRRKGRGKKIVQCRIPIRLDLNQPGSSQSPAMEELLVQQISEIFIKYNFTKSKSPQEIKELVAKVNQMVNTGKPIQLESCDDLTASICRVLLQKRGVAIEPPPMPPLTDVEAEPKRRGRSRKPTPVQPHETPPVAQPEETVKTGGRLRRKAAIRAESRFELNDDCASQDSVLPEPVIEHDDNDWRAAASDTDSAPETVAEPEETKPVVGAITKLLTVLPLTPNKRELRADESSIILSDDDASPPPPSVGTPRVATTEESVTALHPSLLSNQNFIKIVAHTYLAGNPMLDEDAATLAAQYSTFKLLKESESSGKPIESGPIYDIAVKVLGESVLRRLQQQSLNKSKDSAVESNPASSKMMQILGQDASSKTLTPEPAPVRNKPGPKSRVKAMREKPQEVEKAASSPATLQTKGIGLVPVDLLRRIPTRNTLSPTPAPPAQAAGECILPDDDDDVRCITELLPSTTPAAKLPLVKLKLQTTKREVNAKLKTIPETQKMPLMHVTAGGSLNTASVKAAMPAAPAPAPAITYATISLDSDDDEPIVTPAPAQQRVTRTLPSQYAPPGGGPVPVSLTGPDSKPIPLSIARHAPSPPPTPPELPQTSQSTFYPHPIRYPSEPISVSLAGPDAGPVPISLTGPDNRTVPISLSGPGFQVLTLPMGVGPRATPASSAAPVSMPMTYTIPSTPAGMGVRPISVSFNSASPQPTVLTGPDGMRTMRLTLAPGQATSGLQQIQHDNNVYLVPVSQQQTPSPAPLQPTVTKTYCKPGDILRLTPSGKLEIVKSGSDVILTIDDDDEPQPVSVAKASTPNTRASTVKKPASKVATPTPAPAPKVAPPTPAPAPKVAPPTPAPAPKTLLSTPAAGTLKIKSIQKDRRKRKVISSSSSSDSSRSPTPDPLSILKDVVHIQAPERKLKIKSYSDETKVTDASKKPSTADLTKQASSETKSTPNPSSGQQSAPKHNVLSKKRSDILQTVITKKSNIVGGSKSHSNATNTKITDSIDLTNVPFITLKDDTSKFTKVRLSTIKKDGPTTVVGTSKNIVLDGRSKSLSNKDSKDLTKLKSVQVSKVVPPSSTSNKPPEKKRLAPPTEAPPKKKKTEPMTLKDFDIDDIDDIIELD